MDLSDQQTHVQGTKQHRAGPAGRLRMSCRHQLQTLAATGRLSAVIRMLSVCRSALLKVAA